jgi:hypothetical protein
MRPIDGLSNKFIVIADLRWLSQDNPLYHWLDIISTTFQVTHVVPHLYFLKRDCFCAKKWTLGYTLRMYIHSCLIVSFYECIQAAWAIKTDIYIYDYQAIEWFDILKDEALLISDENWLNAVSYITWIRLIPTESHTMLGVCIASIKGKWNWQICN